MSVRIPAGVDAYFVQNDFFSVAQAQPISILSHKKVAAWNSAGFYDRYDVQLSSRDRTHYYASQVAGNSGTRDMCSRSAAGGSAVVASYNLGAGFENQWRVQGSVFATATDRKVYTVDSTDALQSGSNTSSRSPAGVTDLEIFVDTWSPGDTYLAYLAIYQGVVTGAEVQEFEATGRIAAKTPYALYKMTTDWASTGGQILDSSGNGRHITPPGSWVYSADNPDVQTTTASIPQITFEDQGVAVQAGDLEIFARLDSDDTLIYSASNVISNASGVISAVNVETGNPSDAVWVRAISKTAGKAFWVKTALEAPF